MITTLVYRDNRFAAQNPPVDSLATLRNEAGVMLWVDLAAPTAEEVRQVLEIAFAFHPLTVEDCVADSPFPKLEDYSDYLYLVMHAIGYSRDRHFTTTELDLFLGKNFLVTFHREPLKPVQLTLDRYLRTPETPVRGPDRFAHAILDQMIEACQPALGELRHALEQIEEGVIANIDADDLFPRVVALRKDLSKLRQILRPQQEIAAELAAGRNKFVRAVMVPYLRDFSEELARIEAQAGAWAEQLILSFRIYLNKSGYQANQGIRILTGITALTVPVAIVGSWYGMNFVNMHELSAAHGYPVAIALTLVGTAGMLVFMRKKRWL